MGPHPDSGSSLTVPARLTRIDEARRFVADRARAAGFDAKSVHAVELALAEALSNLVRHAYSGRDDGEIDVTVSVDDRRLEVVMAHTGKPFDREAYQPPDLDDPQAGGYGVYLIDALMDEVEESPAPGGKTALRLVKYRDAGDS